MTTPTQEMIEIAEGMLEIIRYLDESYIEGYIRNHAALHGVDYSTLKSVAQNMYYERYEIGHAPNYIPSESDPR